MCHSEPVTSLPYGLRCMSWLGGGGRGRLGFWGHVGWHDSFSWAQVSHGCASKWVIGGMRSVSHV